MVFFALYLNHRAGRAAMLFFAYAIIRRTVFFSS